jgi:hypothetical protein
VGGKKLLIEINARMRLLLFAVARTAGVDLETGCNAGVPARA